MGDYSKGVTTNLIRMICDTLVCLFAFLISGYMIEISYNEYWGIYIVFNILVLLAFKSYHLYNVNTFYYSSKVVQLISKPYLMVVGIFSVFIFYVANRRVDVEFMITFLICAYLFLLGSGFYFHYLIEWLSNLGAPRTLLVGSKEMYKQFYEYIKNGNNPINIIGFICEGSEKKKGYLDCIIHLEQAIHEYNIDQIYIFQTMGKENDTNQYIKMCMEMGITVKVLLQQSKLDGAHSYVSNIGNNPVIAYHTVSLNKYAKIIKRMVDVIGSLVGLIVLSPIMLGVAVAVKISSKGPVIFQQERIGLNGRRFKIYKFRSMYADAEEQKKKLLGQNEVSSKHMFKIHNDPRITRVGKFIRRTSLDELPQLFNVLKGDMSLVGTRPPTVDEVEYYERWHWKRLSIKPGITGMWQVNGRNSITDFERIVELDTEYIANWNLILDIKILCKTFVVIFKPNEAY